MSQTLEAALEFANVAELLHHLGNVPAERVRLRPSPGTATTNDAVLNNERKQRRLVELVDGVLMEKTMGYDESRLAMLLGHLMLEFLDQHDLGIVAGEAGMLEISANVVRIPDVSFIAWDSLPNQEVPRKPCPELVPDLAIEVISAGNTNSEMERKRREYFDAGVKLLWYLYPETQTMDVYNAAAPETAITRTDRVDGGEVLPGFELSLPKLFAKAAGGKG